jgi:hypothetical protein
MGNIKEKGAPTAPFDSGVNLASLATYFQRAPRLLIFLSFITVYIRRLEGE